MGEMITFAACPRVSNGCPDSILMCFISGIPRCSTTGGERFLEPTSSDKMSLMEKERDLPPPGLLEGDLRVLLWKLLQLLLELMLDWSDSAAMKESCGW